ncbi:MAG: MBOAT family O-acyltransferase [Candidatus Alcyoniella australis]|nr:MBOAT family O-acyltransferase [Candidatus Alcyoniella australis]
MSWIVTGFALFVCLVWAVFMLLPARLRGHWMLLASLCYFALEGWRSLLLVAAMLLWVWLLGLLVGRGRPRLGVGLGVAGLLAILAVGKYSQWLLGMSGSLAATLGLQEFSSPQWLAPLGLSYFVFRMISYLADVSYGRIQTAGPLRLAGYVLFFPTLPAGPIERFGAFDPQAVAGARPTFDDLRVGLGRVAAGLFKKLVLADTFWELGRALKYADETPTALLWLALYAYTLHIYFDFSGYSDMAIGIARLFGIRIRENFDWPYARTNIADFWRHWHMSLTAFITEYIYYPLGGNRSGQLRAGINTLIAMGLCGMWHGSGWHFLAWGLYHGAGLTIYRLWRNLRKQHGLYRPQSTWRKYASWLLTLNFVALGWVMFLLPFKEALSAYLALLGIQGVQFR